ncbi:FG-GAP-like repeat-containing protein [Nafulsella turpanensis]|uniref:FG-GAP-like repeat-containing protein n=1 Tax=Nafulsella turpanensis TaxID=1265690 RepID=UPI0003478EA9|nr:FG-GAP-like repeat-containing protein [Nafulsella turpanensis]
MRALYFLHSGFSFTKVCRLIFAVNLFFLFTTLPAQAQVPAIESISPAKAHYGEVVSITGSGFPAQASLLVNFGSVSAEIIEAGATGIKVKVPAGASYAPVTVTNLTTGSVAFSAQTFSPSFGGATEGTATFDPVLSLPASGPFDVCACDLDGDGKNDIVGSNQNTGATAVTQYLNSSSIGNLNFSSKREINVGSTTLQLSCGDLNGDGKPDLVFSSGEKVLILRNSSTLGSINFGAVQSLSAPQKDLSKPVVHDLDADGKPEITLTNLANNEIIVFKNTSTAGVISFSSSPLPFSVSLTTQGLHMRDVNSDGLPDITASSLYGNKVFFLINKSTTGNILFEAPLEFNSNGLSNHAVEDMDGDGKPDLLTLNYFEDKLNIFLNNSSSSVPAFAASQQFTTGLRPTGLQLGDLNGDKKTDILIGHNLEGSAYLMLNKSTAGVLNFEIVKLTAAGKIPYVQISDLDGDAKPDILAADKEGAMFHIFRNNTCLYPTIQPSGPVELCEGGVAPLRTVQSPLAEMATPQLSYQWMKEGTVVGTGPFLEVATPGIYTVTINSGNGCSNTSEPITVNSFRETLGNPQFDIVANACEGQPLVLSISPAVEGVNYTWSNAAGFSQTSTTNSITIPAADPALHSGIYSVQLAKGNCELTLESADIQVNPSPEISIQTEGDLSLCNGESMMLQVQEGLSSYQWKKNGIPITNANTFTFEANSEGSYSVVAQNSYGCETESNAIELVVYEELAVAFEAPSVVCINQPVHFTDQSNLAAGRAADFFWDFGDGNQSRERSPIHSYSQARSTPYTVTLMVQYQNSNCGSTFTKQVTVQNTADIALHTETTEFCPGDSVKVSVLGHVTDVKWSNGDSGLFTYAKDSGLLEAEVQVSGDCKIVKSVNLSHLAKPELTLRSDKNKINIGESVQLLAEGGISYSWEPAEGIDNPAAANPIVSPAQTTTYKVTAWGENGCTTVGEITIEVDLSFTVETPKLFIPAMDGSWKVNNIESYPNISLVIMNKFGKILYKAAPYDNSWTADQLSEDVYFFVFKDASGKVLKSGSISLIR